MHGSSGCLGCDINRKLTSSVDQLKGKERSFWKVEEPNISDDFWTNTTLDMDNSAFQSQGSISSISTSTLDASCSANGNGNTPSVFVNHGLLLWNQTRQQWVGNKESANRAHQLSEPKWSWNATYESMLGSNKRFDKPIPLPEMVDFLVDIWEQEGMYD